MRTYLKTKDNGEIRAHNCTTVVEACDKFPDCYGYYEKRDKKICVVLYESVLQEAGSPDIVICDCGRPYPAKGQEAVCPMCLDSITVGFCRPDSDGERVDHLSTYLRAELKPTQPLTIEYQRFIPDRPPIEFKVIFTDYCEWRSGLLIDDAFSYLTEEQKDVVIDVELEREDENNNRKTKGGAIS